MAQHGIGRRGMLRGAGVAAGGVAITSVGLASPALAEDQGNGRVAGSWMVIRQDDGDPTEVQAVLSFANGGVIISHDISPAGPPFTGTWERRDGNRFRATFWTGFPGDSGPGSAGPTARVKARGRVEHGRISGSYEFTAFDPEGVEIDSGTGSFRGRRIHA